MARSSTVRARISSTIRHACYLLHDNYLDDRDRQQYCDGQYCSSDIGTDGRDRWDQSTLPNGSGRGYVLLYVRFTCRDTGERDRLQPWQDEAG